LDDPLREDASATVNLIRTLGVERVLLVSGDRKSTADKIGAEVGVNEVFAECKPEDKLAIVRAEMKASAGSVIAVGDGINDAPALAAASVGVAMGAKGSTAASEAADVVIVEDSIKHLAIAISVAKGSRGRALQAAGIGMSLSAVAMLFASTGVIDATASALTQELIDTASILWALVPVALATKKN
jgi:P-type E1-E2 ATPase